MDGDIFAIFQSLVILVKVTVSSGCRQLRQTQMSAHLPHLSTPFITVVNLTHQKCPFDRKVYPGMKTEAKERKPKKDESVIYILGFAIVVLS